MDRRLLILTLAASLGTLYLMWRIYQKADPLLTQAQTTINNPLGATLRGLGLTNT